MEPAILVIEFNSVAGRIFVTDLLVKEAAVEILDSRTGLPREVHRDGFRRRRGARLRVQGGAGIRPPARRSPSSTSSPASTHRGRRGPRRPARQGGGRWG